MLNYFNILQRVARRAIWIHLQGLTIKTKYSRCNFQGYSGVVKFVNLHVSMVVTIQSAESFPALECVSSGAADLAKTFQVPASK
jgi:hypothetical protein